MRPIYLDNNSTTACDPRVVEAMLPYFHDIPGNAASRSHPFGWQAEAAVDQARDQIASLLSVQPKEIIFTSGATEGDNLCIKGVYDMYRRKGNHIITLETEHKAVIDACERVKQAGARVTYLPVSADGLIDIRKLADAITEDTILVSIMWVNNETGVVQPMKEIGDLCAERGVFLMSDATQAVGKMSVRPRDVGVHLMAFSAHKMYGPKGVGAVYVSSKDPRMRLLPQMDGGGHERGFRSGTLNVPGIVGLGKAAEIAQQESADDMGRITELRDLLESSIVEQIEDVQINANTEHRLGNVTNLSFKHVVGERLMSTFNHSVAVSSGSACTSASTDPSHVLLALGIGEDAAHSSVRFSIGKYNTQEEIDRVIAATVRGVNRLREESPVWKMYKQGIQP